MLSKEQVKKICAGIKNARIGIIGDFCVDIYWHADMTKSELSRETPHYPLPIVGERVYLSLNTKIRVSTSTTTSRYQKRPRTR